MSAAVQEEEEESPSVEFQFETEEILEEDPEDTKEGILEQLPSVPDQAPQPPLVISEVRTDANEDEDEEECDFQVNRDQPKAPSFPPSLPTLA